MSILLTLSTAHRYFRFALQFRPFHFLPETPESGRLLRPRATASRPRLPMIWHSRILSAWQDRNICQSSLRSAEMNVLAIDLGQLL